MNPVVTRFAPSPTGFLHAGNYRTAIFAYLFAKKNKGKFILRIEDTDQARSKKEFEENILETLEWLGLHYDDLFHQSAHVGRHASMLKKLIDAGKAYEAEDKVIRFRNPNIALTFEDLIRGPITFDTTELQDFVIARSVSSPLYHFAVVVDDADEGVTHIIRGEDHISNTPRQILLQQALGLVTPLYAHLPLVLAPDRTKLSKRGGAQALLHYRDEGYLSQAIVNYLSLLGWHPEGEKELFTPEELVEAFNIKRIQKGAGVFDETKLKWFNHEHLKKLPDSEYAKRLKEFSGREVDQKLIPLLRERAQTLKEARELLDEYTFLTSVSYEAPLLLNRGKIDSVVAKKHLEAILKLMANMSTEDSTPAEIKQWFMPYADKEGRGEVLWPLRVALSGKERSPDPFTIIALIGNTEAQKRVADALLKL